MPSTKQFEYMSLSTPFKIDYMDMYEMLDHHHELIKQLFEMIEQEKEPNFYASVEIPEDEDHWYIWKEGNRFILENNNIRNPKRMDLEPIEFYNWCFEKAPFMSLVGRGYHEPSK